MWEQDWTLLGIEPTTELAAIKKAYALKLRVTRPDDDAEAYQALRDTYERAQAWVKRQREDDVVKTMPSPPALATVEEPPLTDAALEPPPEPEHIVQPRHLVDELELRWRRNGEAALMFGWEEARRELDHQPLSRQLEFSAAFAQWVLGLPDLPDPFLQALDAHFGWLNDFRVQRQLGPQLAQALHAALDARLRPRSVDPAVRALADPLLRLHSLRRLAPNSLKLRWLFFLLQPTIARHQIMLGPQWLQQLGLDDEVQRWLKESVKQGIWARIAVVWGLVFAACMAMFGDFIIAAAHAISWFLITTLALFGGLMAGALVNTGPTLTTPTRRWSLPLDRWRQGRWQPMLGLVWLLCAAALAWLDASPTLSPPESLLSLLPPWTYGWLCAGLAVAGLLLAWPLDGLHGVVVGGLAALTGHLVTQVLTPWLPAASSLLIGAAWMLWAAAIHESRLPGPPPARWLVRPMLNSFALANRWTFSTAVLPTAACSTWAVLTDGAASPWSLFMIWLLAILAVAWLQAKADALGLRQLPEAIET